MLEGDYQQQLNHLLETTPLAPEWTHEQVMRLRNHGLVPPDSRRQHPRMYYPGRAILEVDQTFPAIPRSRHFCQAVTLDLSRGGISFMSPEQLFPGEKAVVWATSGRLPCTIARCVRHGAKCFEVGASFERIDRSSVVY